MRLDQALSDQASRRPDAPAIRDTLGHDWTFAGLDHAVDALAERLAASGVAKDDRVLLLVENCAPAIAAIYAASRLGAVAIPCNARLSEAEVDRVIDHATPAAVLMTSDISTEAAAHAARMGAHSIEGIFGRLDLRSLPSDPDPDMADVGVLLYTTGTTGKPKGVMLTHDNLIFGGNASRVVRGLTEADVVYGVLPVSHVFGLSSIVVACTLAGAAIRLEPRYDPKRLYEALQDGITALSAVPQMLAKLMHYTETQGHTRLPASQLRYVSSGAAPLDLDWKRRTEAFFGLPLQNGYGMTEATAGVCVTQHDKTSDDISVGPALPGVELRIDTDAPGGEGTVGEILVRGGNVMKGYFRNPEATDAALTEGGWLRTGDLGELDTEGNLNIRGRSKELIIHGGFNVYPPEVEAALNDHPKVIQSAVIGHLEGGDEKVWAYVEVSPDDHPSEEELRAFVGQTLVGYKRPSRIVLTERLPAAPTGKILKHLLHSQTIPLAKGA